MKKSVIIMICIIYIASIVAINFFGMKMSVYNEEIPVEYIECTNTTDENRNITVYDGYGSISKEIVVEFEMSDFYDDTYTIGSANLQITTHVYPDNATTKAVKYRYSQDVSNMTFHKDGSGRETGMIMFTGPTNFDLDIISTDGRNIKTRVSILVLIKE